jgi:hypothetical protein
MRFVKNVILAGLLLLIGIGFLGYLVAPRHDPAPAMIPPVATEAPPAALPAPGPSPVAVSPPPAAPIAEKEVEISPAKESEPELDGGLTLARRQEIYQALYDVGMHASAEAQRRFPLSQIPVDLDRNRRYVAQHQQVYQAQKKAGRVALVKRFKVDGAALDRIDTEGMAKKWPLKDAPPEAPKKIATPPPAPAPAVSAYPSGSYTGPRGGVYHYSRSGKKVYERHR